MSIRRRLIIAFLTLGIAAALAVGALSIYTARNLFAEYSGGQREIRLAQWRDIAAGYYAETGSWDGVATILAARNASPGSLVGGHRGMGGMGGPGAGMGGMGSGRAGLGTADWLVLTDTQGEVIAGALPTGQSLDPEALASAYDVVVDGATVGKVADLSAPTVVAAADAAYLAAVGRATITGVLIVAAVAVAAGALLARRIAAPISDLTRAVDLGGNRPVPLTGSGEVRQLAESFNAMLARLRRNEQVRRTMVSDIAHELRTPLTVLGTHLEQLGGICTGDVAHEVLSLQDEVLRMNRLVSDLQTLSLADAGALTLNRQQTELRPLLARIVELTSPVAAEQGVSVELDASAGLVADVDQDRITQAVLNLVTNALRHSPGGGRVTISLSAGMGDGALITVSDTGPGIGPADLPLVFERFYRADPARGRDSGGSGLGLAIVRSIVEAHGGRVWAESQPGQGARFFIALPAAPRQDSPRK